LCQVQEYSFSRIKVLLDGSLLIAINVENAEIHAAYRDSLACVWLPDGIYTYGLAGDDSNRSKCGRLPR
jgi:hypothetical protein